jgi:antitoxin (DNA-binding transcriptional repressor) of toxin-antitoxin stability system
MLIHLDGGEYTVKSSHGRCIARIIALDGNRSGRRRSDIDCVQRKGGTIAARLQRCIRQRDRARSVRDDGAGHGCKNVVLVVILECLRAAENIRASVGQDAGIDRARRARVGREARGSFQVKLVPLDPSTVGKDGGIGRMTIDKTISGDMAGKTKGEMLSTITESTGAMAYVAIETVTARLDGRGGTFVFIHNATMKKADQNSSSMQISVVPGSGTGGFAGISGTFEVHIDGAGKHTYIFDCELP